ncbi:MAG: hypothetical protein POELPBGB_04303 [Bacteroidia bacterium]|nr:hypothetical protein [Bacteroidia bacterium]
MAASSGVGRTNIRGLVASLRKLAATIGMSFMPSPSEQAATASSRQA